MIKPTQAQTAILNAFLEYGYLRGGSATFGDALEIGGHDPCGGGGGEVCPTLFVWTCLINAIHSRIGNVLPQLLTGRRLSSASPPSRNNRSNIHRAIPNQPNARLRLRNGRVQRAQTVKFPSFSVSEAFRS